MDALILWPFKGPSSKRCQFEKKSADFKNQFLKPRAPASAPILLNNLQFTVAAGLQFQFFKFATLWHCRATIWQAFPHQRPHFPLTLYESKIPTRSRSPQSSSHSRPLSPSPSPHTTILPLVMVLEFIFDVFQIQEFNGINDNLVLKSLSCLVAMEAGYWS